MLYQVIISWTLFSFFNKESIWLDIIILGPTLLYKISRAELPLLETWSCCPPWCICLLFWCSVLDEKEKSLFSTHAGQLMTMRKNCTMTTLSRFSWWSKTTLPCPRNWRSFEQSYRIVLTLIEELVFLLFSSKGSGCLKCCIFDGSYVSIII